MSRSSDVSSLPASVDTKGEDGSIFACCIVGSAGRQKFVPIGSVTLTYILTFDTFCKFDRRAPRGSARK